MTTHPPLEASGIKSKKRLYKEGVRGLTDPSSASMRTLSSVFPACQHLRGSVASRPAERLHEAPLLELASKTKVGELDVASLVEKDVLQLEVSVNDSEAVDVSDREAQLTKHSSRLHLAQSALFDEVVEEFTARA